MEDLGFQFERSYYPGKVVVPPGTEGLSYTGNEKVWPFCEQAKPAPRGHSVPVPGELGGAAMVIDLLVKRADELGVAVRYETGVTNLVVDDGAVVGVRVEALHRDRGHPGQGRVIAAGGFAMNPEMVAEYTPKLGKPQTSTTGGEPYILGNTYDDGLGIRMGESAGGATKHMDQIFITAAAYPPEILLTGIIVNKDGQRFVAEDSYHSRTSAFVMDQPDSAAYPDRRRGAHGDARDAADQVHRRLGDRRRRWRRRSASRRATWPPRSTATTSTPRAGEDPDFHKQPEFLAAQDNGPWAAFDLSLGKAMYSGFTDRRARHVTRRRGAARGRQRGPRAVRRGRVRVEHRPGRQGLLPAAPSWARDRSSAAARARTPRAASAGARPADRVWFSSDVAQLPLAVAEQVAAPCCGAARRSCGG